MVHWHMRQPDAAMADFDQALKLKPDDLPALMARAALLLQRGDADLAVADLSVGDRHRTTHAGGSTLTRTMRDYRRH